MPLTSGCPLSWPRPGSARNRSGPTARHRAARRGGLSGSKRRLVEAAKEAGDDAVAIEMLVDAGSPSPRFEHDHRGVTGFPRQHFVPCSASAAWMTPVQQQLDRSLDPGDPAVCLGSFDLDAGDGDAKLLGRLGDADGELTGQ